MSQKTNKSGKRIWRSRFSGLLSAALCAGVLAGCSSVPDEVNPVEWYRGTRDWITGADEPAEAKTAPKPSTADSKAFPTLDTVPPRPMPPTVAERNQIARSLAADRDQARYSDEIIRRQTDSTGKMTETRLQPPAQAAMPKVSKLVPAAPPARPPSVASAMQQPPPAPRPAVPAAPATPPAASASAGAPPFPPMPAAPPAPARMGNDVPPMPAAASALPSLPRTGTTPPPMPRPAPASPAVTPPPLPGNLTFGPVPSDIALNSVRPAAPRMQPSPRGTGQRFVPARQFSSRFTGGVGIIPQPFAAATGQRLGTVRFAQGSARLGNSARAAIRRMAQTIKQSGLRVRVIGHASSRTRNLDPMSHHLVNFTVSLDRANAVARELRRRGVDPAAITVESVSDTEPAYKEVMPAGEAANRRVEILIEN